MSAAKYLLLTEIKLGKKDLKNAVNYFKELRNGNQSRFYFCEKESRLLNLCALSDLNGLQKKLVGLDVGALNKNLISCMHSDFHQEILVYQETVIAQNGKLPNSQYLQLRHIEVPLKLYDEYLDWRKRTIFNHVKELDYIDSFIAYHSLLSTLPGVMFVCGYSCSPEEYRAGFSNEVYQEIIRQAGDRYIAGGEQGLFTKNYIAL